VNAEQTPKSLSARTGFFAVLSDSLRAKGSGVPSSRQARLAFAPLLAVLATATLLVLALFASAASAAQTHLFRESFGSAGSAAGQFELAVNSGIAVDEASHDLYLADTGNHRVDQFSAAGAFIRAFGADVGGPGVDVCTTSCGPGTQTSAAGGFEAPAFIAIDNAPGGEGDVYVADAATNIVSKFKADGTLIAAWGDGGPAEAPDGRLLGKTAVEPFAEIAGIAVDAAGNLDLIQELPELFQFSRAGTFLTTFEIPRFSARAGLAVDPNGDFFKLNGSPSVEKFEGQAPPNDLGQVTVGESSTGLAVDASDGELYVDQGTRLENYVFEPSGEVQGAGCTPAENVGCPPTGTFGAGHLIGGGDLAVDGSNHSVYAADPGRGKITVFTAAVLPDTATEAASAIGPHGATLHGTITAAGGPPANCEFEYTTDGSFSEHEFEAATAVPCVPPGPFTGTSSESVSAELTGLAAGTSYRFRLVGSNENGTSPAPPDSFETSGPLILSDSVSEVSATAATLEAELNPHGLPTTYHFEYDTVGYTEAGGPHGESTPTASAGAGSADVTRSALIQGLQSATTYHYRVVAENLLGTAEGPDRTFTTEGAVAASLLPDARGWELVSPPDKLGTPVEPAKGVIQAAQNGDGIAYLAAGALDQQASGTLALDQVLASRNAGTWSSQDVSTAHQAPVGPLVGSFGEYRLFSADLSLAALEPEGATPLSPQASERTPYLRNSDQTFTPLVTAANVPPETKFGGEEEKPEVFVNGVNFVTGTSDLAHLLLASRHPLTADFAGFEPEQPSIYEWSSGALALVSQIPAGGASCGGSAPACEPAAEAGQSSQVGNGGEQVRHAISSDGSRVVFETLFGSPGSPSLYLRDLAREETLALDAAEPGCARCESGGAVYQDASLDGSRIFFTDRSRLTADSTASSLAADLYMCQVIEESGGLACELTDLTANSLDPADVQGTIIGTSGDGSRVFFVANAALTTGEGAVHGDCPNGTEGFTESERCNLYRYDTESRRTALIAVLSGVDFPDWQAGASSRNLGELTARVSPDGRYLAFMSQRPLTGYDNRDALSGQRDEEVYLYDSLAEGGEGRLLCASCNPTGARPLGIQAPPESLSPALIDPLRLWPDRWLAATLPGWDNINIKQALYQPRYLANSGRLFLNAADALVPEDANDTVDAYQYEPPGVGGCAESSPSFAARNGGCVSLISSGTSSEESVFLDASESGDDIFFFTASKLTAKDVDDAYDIYDAHVNGGEPEIVKPVECSGDACQQPAMPPNHPIPGTAVLNGPGNLLQCPKGKVKKRSKCVPKKRAKKHHGKKHHSSHKRAANHNRRVGK